MVNGNIIGSAINPANVARNFVHQPVKDTAMALLERAEGIRRGTVRLFHAGLMPAERLCCKPCRRAA